MKIPQDTPSHRLITVLFAVLMLLPMPAMATSYYVDSAGGSDSNAGTSATTPWQTLAKVNSTALLAGDAVLLKAGDTWTSQFLDINTESGAAGSPITVSSYGSGKNPVINFADTCDSAQEGWGVRVRDSSYVEISNLEITSGVWASDSYLRNGVWIVADSGGTFHHVYVTNVYVHDVFGNSRRTGGIDYHIVGANTGPESLFDDIQVTDCAVYNVAAEGIQTMSDAFLNPSWVHQTNAYTNVLIKNCSVSYVSWDAILLRGSPGGVVENCEADHTGQLLAGAPTYVPNSQYVCAMWSYYNSGVIMQNNEASSTVRLEGDGQPWDFDINVTNSVYTRNYSHDNLGGVLLVETGTSGNKFCYNISQNDLDYLMHVDASGVTVFNNTFFRGTGVDTTGYFSPFSTNGVNSATYGIYNNIFYNLAGAPYYSDSDTTYAYNLFYGSHPASEPTDAHKVTSDPQLVAPGMAANGFDTSAAYQIASASSPAINAGEQLTLNPGTDFFGNAVPLTGAVDIGAHQFTPIKQFAFASGSAPGWTVLNGTWTTVLDSGSYVYNVTAPTNTEGLSYSSSGSWADSAVQASVKIATTNGNGGVLLRYVDDNNYLMYRVNLAAQTMDLYQKTTAGGLVQVGTGAAVSATTNTYYTIQATVIGSQVLGYFQGTLVGTWNLSGSTSGTVALRTNGSNVNFSGVRVLNAYPVYEVSSFSAGTAPFWTVGGGTWSVVSDGGYVYSVANTSVEATSTRGNTAWHDGTVQSSVKITQASGNGGVVFRYADANDCFWLRLNASTGALELYKKVAGAYTLLKSVAVSATNGTVYSLKAGFVTDPTTGLTTVNAYLGGALEFEWSDTSVELSAGSVGLRSSSSSCEYSNVSVLAVN